MEAYIIVSPIHRCGEGELGWQKQGSNEPYTEGGGFTWLKYTQNHIAKMWVPPCVTWSTVTWEFRPWPNLCKFITEAGFFNQVLRNTTHYNAICTLWYTHYCMLWYVHYLYVMIYTNTLWYVALPYLVGPPSTLVLWWISFHVTWSSRPVVADRPTVNMSRASKAFLKRSLTVRPWALSGRYAWREVPQYGLPGWGCSDCKGRKIYITMMASFQP